MSPSIKIISLLQKKGSRVFYHDPHVPHFLLSDKKMTSIDFEEKNLKKFDCVVIAVDHSAYKWEKIFKESSLIVDIKNVSKNFAKFKEKIFKA
jgi:UDP-N-acetyl-D-glucosamine dehydrogenase